MKLFKYLNELKVGSGTDINVVRNNNKQYFVDILVPNDKEDSIFKEDLFKFYAYAEEEIYFSEDGNIKFNMWIIDFVDESNNINRSAKSPKVALRLFAAIEKVVTDLIKIKKPEAIEFSSGDYDPARLKLYDLLAKKLVSKGGYVLVHPQSIMWRFFKPELYKKIEKGLNK